MTVSLITTTPRASLPMNKSEFKFRHESDGTLSLSSAVAQALGYASTCWTTDGIFESERASQCADKLVDFIETREGKRS